MDEEAGKLTVCCQEYLLCKDCLGNQTLEFMIQDYGDYDEILQALQNHEIILFMPAEILILQKKGYAAYKYSLDLQPDGSNR